MCSDPHLTSRKKCLIRVESGSYKLEVMSLTSECITPRHKNHDYTYASIDIEETSLSSEISYTQIAPYSAIYSAFPVPCEYITPVIILCKIF